MENYLTKYADKEVLSQREADVKAMQEGGVAPAQQSAAPAGPEGGQDPNQLLAQFVQAMQAGDKEAAMQIAMEFTSIVAQSAMQEQQASQQSMRRGGVNRKPIVFKKK